MGKYIVTNGQNIYDISLHLYGSIEGIVDLMMFQPTYLYKIRHLLPYGII